MVNSVDLPGKGDSEAMLAKQCVERVTMDAKEGAIFLGVSYWKLLEMVKAGIVPHVRVPGSGKCGRVLFRKSSLDAWLQEQEVASIAKPGPEPVGKIRRLK